MGARAGARRSVTRCVGAPLLPAAREAIIAAGHRLPSASGFPVQGGGIGGSFRVGKVRMSKEPTPSAESDLPRAREDTTSRSLPQRVSQHRAFKPVLLLLVASAAGMVLAPGWIIRSYPTDSSLVGQPATADIKAGYSDRGDIVDAKTTARLREEAVARVRRIYDFDPGRGEQLARSVRDVLSELRQGGAAAAPAADGAPDGAAPAQGADQAQPVGQAAAPQGQAAPQQPAAKAAPVTPAQLTAAFRERLGAELGAKMARVLAQDGPKAATADFLAEVVRRALTRPVVVDASALTEDQERGIVIRNLNNDGQRVVGDVASVLDVPVLRERLPGIVEEVARDRGALPPDVTAAITQVAGQLIQPTLTLNGRDTQIARDEAAASVAPVTLTVKRGQMIIRDGEVFTERHLLILRQMAQYSHNRSVVLVSTGAALLVLMLILAGLTFGGRQRVKMSPRDALFMSVLFVLALVGAKTWIAVAIALQDSIPEISGSAIIYLLPIAAGAMMARLVLRVEMALVFGVVTSLLLGLLADGEKLITIYALVGTVTGATAIGTISRRGDILRAGLWVGGAQALTALGLLLFSAEGDVLVYLATLTAAFASGLLAGFVTLAVTPVVEMAFGYTTDLKLLELANLNHPALKELIVQAPGTYHHSIIVGALVEAAAEEIGANALLAKVMAYYHDLGKGCNAMYFIENQRAGSNPHDKLKPSMSAMIIKRHVTDGLEVAERYTLGKEIRAGIAEHHGTTLIQYFYARALEEAEDEREVSESDYRYPGRKPQSRETALVMLGDSVEAAARSLADPTPARLRGLVNKIINGKFADGQLEECDLTLRDLHTIARAFMKVLTSLYHTRVEYPDTSKKAEGKRTGEVKRTAEMKRSEANGRSVAEGAPRSGKPVTGSVPKPAKEAASNGHSDSESEAGDTVSPAQEDRPDNLRRLGL